MPKSLQGKAVPISKQPNRGKGAGRKPNIIKKIAKEANISKADAQKLLLEILNYTPEKVNSLVKSEYNQVTLLRYSFLTAAQTAMKKGDFSTIKQMLDFIYGSDTKPLINITNNTQLVDLKTVIIQKANTSTKERERIIGELEKITGYEE
jgi:DNA-directed RNA polymerase specialized sigma subunit